MRASLLPQSHRVLFSFYVIFRTTCKETKPPKKLCFLQIEMSTFKMVSTKTKCITVEAKLKNSGGPVTWPVSLANFTFCDGTDLSDSSVGERGSRNTVFLTDDMEDLE